MDLNATAGPDGYVAHTYDAGFVVLSYLVSFAGCWTSLELLHRKTGRRGYYNWYLLIAAACSMGAVAIWCMHFIGNRAVTMDHGQKHVQIQYNAGFTAASFFDPIIVVGLAFYFFSISEHVSILGTVAGGLLTGCAITGMHYMGQGGIANYHPTYLWPFVFGSAIIAVVASSIALGIFFYLKSTWTNSWWKRGICASILAGAVSGMHWTATGGTQYRLKAHDGSAIVGLSRQATVIVVICLCIGCLAVLIAFAMIGKRSRRLSADRAQQVVLALATFDQEGRLMVTPEGLLPCRKITDSYAGRSFEDVFDVDHSVFCWVFRASRCWRTVAALVPGIRAHLQCIMPSKPLPKSKRLETRALSVVEKSQNYSLLFKELFCVAAKDLADQTQEQLEDIGVLYGKIMSTGTLSKKEKLKIRGLNMKHNTLNSAERGESPVLFGRGQILFVVRRATRSESSRLQAVGHRFATIPNVIDRLARSLEVTREELHLQLDSMCSASEDDQLLAPGVHLGCFALRPVFHRGFDILVHKEISNLLPTTFLTKSKLEQWQVDILQRMDNLTVASCCDLLSERRALEEERGHKFAGELLEAIHQLSEKINDPFFGNARLVARPLQAPCSAPKGCQMPQQAFLVNFRIMVDAHQSNSLNGQYEYAPLKFFLCQQHAYKGSPDNHIFARKVHREFMALARNPNEKLRGDSINSANHSHSHSSCGSFVSLPDRPPSPAKKKGWPTRVHLKGFDIPNDDCSNALVDQGITQPYGGIHVSNDIDVDISEIGRESHSPDVEMKYLGAHCEVGSGDLEQDSFADMLVALTVDERRRHHTVIF